VTWSKKLELKNALMKPFTVAIIGALVVAVAAFGYLYYHRISLLSKDEKRYHYPNAQSRAEELADSLTLIRGEKCADAIDRRHDLLHRESLKSEPSIIIGIFAFKVAARAILNSSSLGTLLVKH
jgi:hypothetical protein